ncbi:putative membrane protein [Diaporthe ampelina]|uniref:Putative membrane protein n=1 Tax=Diaporthe ampelina TaxID=1214573 RepID=A0A0G2IF44_9PEZI|nr:putative membrane protein [Diaporthe ampelina]
MAIGSAAKQIFWVAYLSQEEFPPKSALVVSAFNSVCNSANSLLLLTTATSAALSTKPLTVPVPGTRAKLSLPVAVGTVLYILGILLETASELQRKRFKDKPEHKGRLCREGLWSWARHINYTGYTLWRGGYALAAGGWVAGIAVASFHVHSFIGNGIVSLDYYMSRRYKDQWGRYKEDVKWKLVPGVY